MSKRKALILQLKPLHVDTLSIQTTIHYCISQYFTALRSKLSQVSPTSRLWQQSDPTRAPTPAEWLHQQSGPTIQGPYTSQAGSIHPWTKVTSTQCIQELFLPSYSQAKSENKCCQYVLGFGLLHRAMMALLHGEPARIFHDCRVTLWPLWPLALWPLWLF